ncbi:MAG: ABC transporter substrate-binding protein, partial [Gammaproteobacteria bacterium]
VMLSEFVGRSGPVLDEFVNKHGVIIKKLSDDILQTLGGIAGEVISDLAAKDPMSKKVFASLAKFRNLQLAYSDATEGDFLKARGLSYKFPTG